MVGPNNRLLSDGTLDYEYDAEGNLIRRARTSNNPADDHVMELEWDRRGRLVRVLFWNNQGTSPRRCSTRTTSPTAASARRFAGPRHAAAVELPEPLLPEPPHLQVDWPCNHRSRCARIELACIHAHEPTTRVNHRLGGRLRA